MDSLRDLLPPNLDALTSSYLQADIPSFDVGGAVVGSASCVAHLLAKTPLTVLAGQPWGDSVARSLDLTVHWLREEGSLVGEDPPDYEVVALVTGPKNRVLQMERTFLEIISRCSAVATQAREAVNLAKETGFSTRIAGTRKVTPGFRLVEKYGLMVGGADTHRMDLSSMVMLKDNHVDACGGITQAVQRCREVCSFSQKIEVECRSLQDALEACKAGADVVMLDNFNADTVHTVAEEIKTQFPHTLVEVSGGIRPHTLQAFCGPHIDLLSMGCLTHGTPSVDFSLKIQAPQNQ